MTMMGTMGEYPDAPSPRSSGMEWWGHRLLKRLMPHVLTTWTSFRSVMLHYINESFKIQICVVICVVLPSVMTWGGDMGHRPLREPMPHHPIPEPLGDGASGYQSPLPMVHSNEYQGSCPVSSPMRNAMVNFGGRNFSSCCAAIPPNGTL
jgi:hypothetical protein